MKPKGVGAAAVEPCYRHIGQVMRAARNARRMNQETLAMLLGLTRASIANIETGRQRVMMHDLPGIAEALKLRVRDLILPRWR